MSYSQPTGYRMPASVSLPSISRALERFGWPVWRAETVRALASIAIDLLDAPDDREAVYKRLSHGQISEADLVISTTTERGLLHQAAEFLDVAHGIMHRPSVIPLPTKLDMRCRAQFMDDPEDPSRTWNYVLFGTEHDRLEQVFLQLRGMESYPVAAADDPQADTEPDPGWAERCAVWQRVLAPYSRSSPLSISAPEPQITFDIAESLKYVDRDAEYAAAGKVTVTAAIEEIRRQLGDRSPADLAHQLTARISA
ncbi:hypothetical protein CLV47_101153 [Antricoccus suffuscus]|uniref:Uncharacterized protein n=1 Tax=Antricoccus suffuscus TaxID=1629062 RepID=A0A2T1A612_9ACTN|nr:hypothetical protein [Antricoccus suffuscus]PRZ44029.1 hypothetical protein CLV47_101153 [Antricoccus suffuscus]